MSSTVNVKHKFYCHSWKFVFYSLSWGLYFYCMTHALFPIFFGVVLVLAAVVICPDAEAAVWIELKSLLKQSLKCEKVWSSFAFVKMHESRLPAQSSSSSRGASMGRIDGARGVLYEWQASNSWQSVMCSGEALAPRKCASGEGVWYISSSSLIERTGEFWSLSGLAWLPPWHGLKCKLTNDVGWFCLLEIPRPSYNASNSQREGEFLWQMWMRWLQCVKDYILTQIFVSAADFDSSLAFWKFLQ